MSAAISPSKLFHTTNGANRSAELLSEFRLLHADQRTRCLTNCTISFYTPAFSGGITVLEESTIEMNNDGPQLFSGTLANPVLETYSNLQLTREPFYPPVLNEAFVLNASVPNSTPSAPETQTYGLLATGLGMLGIAVKRKKSVVKP